MGRTLAASSAKGPPRKRLPRVAFLVTRKRASHPCSRMRSGPTAASLRRSHFGPDLAAQGNPKGRRVAGKIVIDCTNPLGMGVDGLQLVLGFNTSAGEQVASWAPGAFVFKTLNTTGAGNMAKAAAYPVPPVMLVAGDDAGKKPKVMELVAKLGFEAADAGPLKNARLLEPFAMVWIDQAMQRGRGREFAFALVSMK